MKHRQAPYISLFIPLRLLLSQWTIWIVSTEIYNVCQGNSGIRLLRVRTCGLQCRFDCQVKQTCSGDNMHNPMIPAPLLHGVVTQHRFYSKPTLGRLCKLHILVCSPYHIVPNKHARHGCWKQARQACTQLPRGALLVVTHEQLLRQLVRHS